MDVERLIRTVEHRPWPLPPGPWSMEQVWHDLLFAHWRVDTEALRARLPAELELDLHEGAAWVGVVPFRMSGVRFRGLPAIPGVQSFPELNLRTYVRHAGTPGVHFFALEAASRVAVRVARGLFHLPYHDARMRCDARGEDVEYASTRTHKSAAPAELTARYGPRGEAVPSVRGALEHWLTERYTLFAVDRRRRVHRADIHHEPWPLQPAWAEFGSQTLARAHGIELPDTAPLLHFARRLEVLVWAPRRV